MADRAEIIKRASIKARNNFDDFQADQEIKLYKILTQTADNINAKLLTYEAAGKIPPARLKALNEYIKQEIAYTRIKLNSMIKGGMSKSVDYGEEIDLWTWFRIPTVRVSGVTIKRVDPLGIEQYLQSDMSWGSSIHKFDGLDAEGKFPEESWKDFSY